MENYICIKDYKGNIKRGELLTYIQGWSDDKYSYHENKNKFYVVNVENKPEFFVPESKYNDIIKAIADYEKRNVGLPIGFMSGCREKVEQMIDGHLKSRRDELEELKHELEVSDSLLADRQRILDALPKCPVHGECIPYALEWIEKHKRIDSEKESLVGDASKRPNEH